MGKGKILVFKYTKTGLCSKMFARSITELGKLVETLKKSDITKTCLFKYTENLTIKK